MDGDGEGDGDGEELPSIVGVAVVEALAASLGYRALAMRGEPTVRDEAGAS